MDEEDFKKKLNKRSRERKTTNFNFEVNQTSYIDWFYFENRVRKLVFEEVIQPVVGN